MIGALHMPHNILPVFLATEYENWHLKCSLCPQLRRVSVSLCFNSSKQTKQISTYVFAAMTNLITVLYLEWAKNPKILLFYKKVSHFVHIYVRYVLKDSTILPTILIFSPSPKKFEIFLVCYRMSSVWPIIVLSHHEKHPPGWCWLQ